MNRLIMIYGCVLLSSSAIATVQQGAWEPSPLKETLQDQETYENLIAGIDPKMTMPKTVSNPITKKGVETSNLDLSTIEYLENEETALGFDPYDYLPEDFDPHSFYFDLNSVVFMDGEDFGLGFDTSAYLPAEFDAYETSAALSSIYFIDGEDVVLGFDTSEYLPKGFSPYESYFDLDSIIYIEMSELTDDFPVLLQEDVTITPTIEEPFN